MKKIKVFIVLSHKHSLKKNSKTEWDVVESVEIVDQLRSRHITMSSAVGDYINRKMESGSRVGMDNYDKFETYIRNRYPKEMAQVDKVYLKDQVASNLPPEPELFTDSHGNVRTRTVFDI